MKWQTITLIIALSHFSKMVAQSQAPSLYSVYGIGVPVSTDFGVLEALSGSSTALRPAFTINTGNPAGLSSVAGPFTMMLSTGLQVQSALVTGLNDDNTSFWDGGMTHLDLWFRFRKNWTAQIGLSPFSVVNYDILSTKVFDPDGSNYQIRTEGDGGVTQMRLAQGWTIFEDWHFGVTGFLYFGSLTTSQSVEGLASMADFAISGQTSLAGLNYNLGLQYSHPLKIGTLHTGIVYRPGTRLNSSQELNLVYAINETLEGDLTDEATYNIPQQLKVGVAYQSKKWMIALDGIWERWSNLAADANSKIHYDDVYSLSVGTEYALFANAYDNPLKAIRLRAGSSLKNSYLVLDDANFLVWQISLGVGLPISHFRNSLNISYRYNHQGRDFRQLWLETSHTISFSIDLRDIWFVKRKIR